MVLSREAVLFPRDEEGNVIPVEVELIVDEDDAEQVKFKGETVLIKPLLRGELKKLFAVEDDGSKDRDGELVIKNCVNPKFVEADIPFMKGLSAAIVNTILFESGVDVLKNRSKKKSVDVKEEEFSKNSVGSGKIDKKVA